MTPVIPEPKTILKSDETITKLISKTLTLEITPQQPIEKKTVEKKPIEVKPIESVVEVPKSLIL